MKHSSQLIYVLDPMCSWCWGFRPVWQQIERWALPRMQIRYVLGGLAPDTDEPMPMAMRSQIQAHWRRIQQEIPGTQFNDDFWTVCQPRRATYPACRAVVAARNIDSQLEVPMIEAIQRAYYLQAQNPSEDEVLIALALELGVATDTFRAALTAKATHEHLRADIRQARAWGVHSFPTVLLLQQGQLRVVSVDYLNSRVMIDQVDRSDN